MTVADAEHVLEMAAAEHDDPVKALGTKCAYSTLGEGVCVRRLNRRADRLDAFRSRPPDARLLRGRNKVDQTSANRRDETLVVSARPQKRTRRTGCDRMTIHGGRG